ncbi:hypothetical protein [Thermococcus sp.]|uniref:hypothetical protein n=1 Tax=Thermococcus sp. TaxID=35749 RepID=UPI002622BE83|nr:hypothetical protein [Thermococcus sp.]
MVRTRRKNLAEILAVMLVLNLFASLYAPWGCWKNEGSLLMGSLRARQPPEEFNGIPEPDDLPEGFVRKISGPLKGWRFGNEGGFSPNAR